jgi:hypothetical protein
MSQYRARQVAALGVLPWLCLDAWFGGFDPWATHGCLSWTVLTRGTAQTLECLQLGQEPQVLRTPYCLLGDNEPGERQDPGTMIVQLDFFGVGLNGFIGAESRDFP